MINSSNKIIIINIISTILVQGLAFFSGPIFSSLMGANNYGIFSVYMTWVSLSSAIFSLQAGGAIPQARKDFEIDEQLKYQSSVLSMGTISYVIFASLDLLMIKTVFSNVVNFEMIIVGLMHGWGAYCISFMNSKFIYEFKALQNAILSIVVCILTIFSSFLLINRFTKNDNYWGRIIGEGGTYFIVGIVLFLVVLIRGKTIVSIKYWRYSLPICLPLIIHSLSGMILDQSDRIMIQKLVGNVSVGIYSLTYTFASIVYIIWITLNRSWVPFFYDFLRKDDIESLRLHAKNYIQLYTIVMMGFILLSKEVFRFYANSEFWNGERFIPLLALAYYFIFLYSFPVNIELFYKKTKVVAVGTFLAATSNLVLNYILILNFQVSGALIATIISSFLQFGFHWILGKKITGESFPFLLKDFIPGFIGVVCSCILFFWFETNWQVRWLVGILLGVYIVIAIIKRKEIF